MRHRIKTQHLSRFSSYFKATIHSLAAAVLINQRIETTKVRAKLARRLVDKLITLGKDVDSLAARRRAFSFLNDHTLVKKLFTEIAPMFTEKTGGYTRITPYRRRRGDNAEMVVLELSVQKAVARPAKPAKEKPAEPKPAEPKAGEHKEAPPEKAKRKKETPKPSKKILGGFHKFFKPERDSL